MVIKNCAMPALYEFSYLILATSLKGEKSYPEVKLENQIHNLVSPLDSCLLLV